MSKQNIQALKGFRDFLPEDMQVQNYIFDTWRSVCIQHGFDEYNAPLLEYARIYQKSGEDIGSSGKELYKFTDNGGREVALRPEMTPSVARIVSTHKQNYATPIKWFSIAQCFRAEKPQKGRLREHFQLNADIFREESTLTDASLIKLAIDVLLTFGANETMFEVKINSRKFMDYYFRNKLGLTKTQDRINLQRVIDSAPKKSESWLKKEVEKIQSGSTFFSDVKKYLNLTLNDIQNLKDESSKDLVELFSLLEKFGLIQYCTFDTSIARGFDYYTGVVFEVFDKNKENRRSLFGGGRYDNLMDVFDKPKLPAVGFGQGDVTLKLFLEGWNLLPQSKKTTSKVLVTLFGKNELTSSLSILKLLRKAHINSELYLNPEHKMAKQLKYANKKGIQWAVIIGPDEILKNEVVLKDLKNNKQESVPISSLLARIN